MFVQPTQRGQGVAQAVPGQVEAWAQKMGYTSCVLETSRNQPEAIALCQKCGYRFISNYQSSVDSPNSVYLQKT